MCLRAFEHGEPAVNAMRQEFLKVHRQRVCLWGIFCKGALACFSGLI